MVKEASFKPLDVRQTFVLRGGYLREPASLPIRHIPWLGDFVKLEKRELWLIKAVCGPGALKRALSRTTLLQTLRDQLLRSIAICPSMATNGPTPSAVADNDGSTLVDGNARGIDLMDSMAFADEAEGQHTRPTTATPTPKK